ncbi:hypothetical protein GCM10025790_09140 [Nesterenkonia rhizosphaerae]|uniref:Uncharacterized protein n=1 Tax=Nesterenkonia rhizosphaerae TaxID=1348272 RepID=A0ABP9FTT0_9MICC
MQSALTYTLTAFLVPIAVVLILLLLVKFAASRRRVPIVPENATAEAPPTTSDIA